MPATKKTTTKKTTAKRTTTRRTPTKKVAPKTIAVKATPVAANTCNTNGGGLASVIILLIVVIILQLISLFSKPNGDIVDLEILKAGGEANFVQLMELYESDAYIEFQTNSINSMQKTLQQANDAAPAADAPAAEEAADTPTPAAAQTIDQEKLDTIAETFAIKGPADADILIIEYSDFECPFCQRHFAQGTLNSLIEKFDGQVAISFRHFPLSFHPNAMPAAAAAECVRDNAGDEAFFAFEGDVFTTKDLSTDGLLAAAEKAGADRSTVKDCLENKDFEQEVKDQMAQGQNRFGVRGTPGNVVLNTTNGKRELVSGAQGAGAFETAINNILSAE